MCMSAAMVSVGYFITIMILASYHHYNHSTLPIMKSVLLLLVSAIKFNCNNIYYDPHNLIFYITKSNIKYNPSS